MSDSRDRKKIPNNIKICFSSFDTCPIDDVLSKIGEIKASLIYCGFSGIRFCVDYQCGHFDYSICGYRLETDEEYEDRLAEEEISRVRMLKYKRDILEKTKKDIERLEND